MNKENQKVPAKTENRQPQIGTDEWVSQVDDRQQRSNSLWGIITAGWTRIPLGGRYTIALLLLLFVPLITETESFLNLAGISNNAFLLRIGARFLIFAMLAIGLNVVVGYAGLLDLGYVAFFGMAGYLYAYLSSEFVRIGDLVPYGLAVPSLISLPLIVLTVAGIGWLLGSVSLRLSGDYLAIVTLGFGQVFVQLALTATRVKVPWSDRPVDLTRGPNGINRLDDISLFGYTFETTLQYYYLLLFLLVIIFVAVHHLNQSRIGRSWRAIREDSLAAEVMGIPTRRMKLLAFAIGAAIAALAGSVDAAWQGNVVPFPRYSVVTLINLYAMVVLGGLGSLPGVVLGAFIFTTMPEVLRSVQLAGFLFYGAGIIALFAWLRPFHKFVLVLGGTIITGYGLKFLVNLLWPGLDAGYPEAGSLLNQVVQGWLVIPVEFKLVGNVVTATAIFGLLLSVWVKRPIARHLLMGATIYLFAFAWETRLAVEPSATRILVVGASLVLFMILRPQGLFGNAEVRVV